MKYNNLLKSLFVVSSLLCTDASFCLDKNQSSIEVNQSMRAIQQMNFSMQKINAIFARCHMSHECILKSLQHLAQTEKDPLAQSMLDDFARHAVMNTQVSSQCFELQKKEVDEALMICITQSREPPLLNDKNQCFENALMRFVEEGNIVAEQVLFTLYQMQNNMQKLASFQEKIRVKGQELHQKGNQRCIKILNK